MNPSPLSEADASELTRLRNQVATLEATIASMQAQMSASERENQALLDTLFAIAPIGLAFVNPELRFVHVNDLLAEINGRSPAEHIGRTVEELLPELGPQLVPFYRQVLTTGEAIRDLEVRGSTPAAPDQLRTWLVSYYPVPGEADTVAGVGVVVLDITERKETEAALKRQAEMLHAQAATLDLAHIIVRDTESQIVTWNRGAEILYGWSSAEALGQLSHQLFRTDFPVSREAYEAQLFQAGAWEGELVHRRKDGGKIVVASHQVLQYDAEGCPYRIIEINNDITALKRTEEELRRMTDRLLTLNMIDRAILSAQTPEQIASVVVARLQQFISCDRIVVSSYDYEQQHIERLAINDARPERVTSGQILPIDPLDLRPPFPLGERWYVPDTDRVEVLPPRAVPHRALGIRSLLHIPLIAEGQTLGFLRLGMERPNAFNESDIAIVGEVADQLAIGLRNAHLRAQVEEERSLLARRIAERTADLSAANAELGRAARVKDEFLSNMSHELRTPLNAILGRTELLREQIHGPLTPQQDSSIRIIAEAGEHLLTLINDILDLSKVEAGRLALEKSQIEVEAIGRAAMRMVSQQAISRKIILTATYDSRVESVLADERRLKQILVNLLSNAVKFTPEGGKVGLEVQADPEQQVVTFTVWDTGIGIAPEDQVRLFQPFMQVNSSLSRPHEGTGLGLALVLRLTELHEGSVTLDSQPGQGSRFSVKLPWTVQAEPLVSTKAIDVEALPATPLTINQALVIEDSQTAVEQLSRYLGDLGCRVEVHTQASGAIERARELKPDLIVLDILLPDQLGWDVLYQLKADPSTAAIPVLVVSVVDEPARAQALGAAGFLLKPLRRDRFFQMFQQLRVTADSAELPVLPLSLLLVAQADSARPLVLLVDDNELNLEVLVDYLPRVGYDVVAARNGAEAVARAEELRPAVIIMDIQMPVMDGLEATRRIRAAGLRDTPIIALTALAMAGDRERCLAAGVSVYLSKPASLRTLLKTMAEELAKGGPDNGATG